MKNQTDFSSRISARAVTAGVMSSISFMLLSFLLISALGIWNFQIHELYKASAGFWILSSIAWAMSMYLAGFVASYGARPQNTAEGAVNAIAACCGSFLLCWGALLLFAPIALEDLLSITNKQFFLRVFLGNFLGFVVGIYGGVVGVHFEQRSMEAFRGTRKVVHG